MRHILHELFLRIQIVCQKRLPTTTACSLLWTVTLACCTLILRSWRPTLQARFTACISSLPSHLVVFRCAHYVISVRKRVCKGFTLLLSKELDKSSKMMITVCVCCFVILLTDIGESLRSRCQFLTPGSRPGVAGSSPFTLSTSLVIPVPSSSSSNGPRNYSVDNHGLVPWRLRRVGRSKVRSASLVRVLSDENGPSGTESQSLSNRAPPTT